MNKTACDKFSHNKILVSNCIMRDIMKQGDFEKIEVTQGSMKVILEFPTQSEQDETIKKEVRSILSSTLQEYLQKIL
jgi:hypothetical protein